MGDITKWRGHNIKDAKARADIEALKKNGVGGGGLSLAFEFTFYGQTRNFDSSFCNFEIQAVEWGDGTTNKYKEIDGDEVHEVWYHEYAEEREWTVRVYAYAHFKNWLNEVGGQIISATVGSAVGEIGDYSFCSQCSDTIEKVIAKEGVHTIGESAFQECIKLTEVKLPEGLRKIKNEAFDYCSSLTEIEIPESVEFIGDYAFAFCPNLKKVTLKRAKWLALGDNIFQGAHEDLKIYVPAKAVAMYQAIWQGYEDKIYAISESTGGVPSEEITEIKNEVSILSEEVAETKNDVTLLSNALLQVGTLYKAETENTYNERTTADGANVLDGSKAVLKKVVGNTVACHNLVNLEAIKNIALLQNVEIDNNTVKLLSGSSFLFDFSHDAKGTAYEKFTKCFGISKAGKYCCTFKSLNNAPASEWRFMIGSNTLFKIGFGSGTVFEVTQENIDAIKSITSGGNIKLIMYGNYDDVFSEIQIVEGEETKPYQPYFTGLKSASFAGIESTNADGTETSTLAFPKTETPLGVTIDFETKKITDYGVDLVLTGNEKIVYYKYGTGIRNSIAINDLSLLKPTSGTVKTPYVSTDSVYYGTDYTPKNIFAFFANFTWLDILDTLGFTTRGTEPTAKEQTTAVANFKAWLAQRYADGNPVMVRYFARDVQSETDFTADNEYTAYKGGAEKVIDNDGAEYGADNTLTQDYIVVKE